MTSRFSKCFPNKVEKNCWTTRNINNMTEQSHFLKFVQIWDFYRLEPHLTKSVKLGKINTVFYRYGIYPKMVGTQPIIILWLIRVFSDVFCTKMRTPTIRWASFELPTLSFGWKLKREKFVSEYSSIAVWRGVDFILLCSFKNAEFFGTPHLLKPVV